MAGAAASEPRVSVLVSAAAIGVAEGMASLASTAGFVDVVRHCLIEDCHRFQSGLKADVVMLMPHPHVAMEEGLIKNLAAQRTPVLLCPFEAPALYSKLAFDSGVSGIVTAEDGFAELPTALRTLSTGGRYMSQSVVMHLVADGDQTLTELEVCKLLALGYSNSEMAEKLFLSDRTIESHRSSLKLKIGAENRRDVVRFALANHLLA